MTSLARTLASTGRLLADARDPWWVLGSAAVVLHGASTSVADVDVLLSRDDARRLLPRIGASPAPGKEDDLFRSEAFATWRDLPLPVEFMAGFHYRRHDHWIAVEPRTRRSIAVGDVTLFVPERAELRDLLTAFGRPKDRTRADLLEDVARLSSAFATPP